MDTQRWMSAREAAAHLELPRESARRLLAVGAAGPGERTRSAILYDAARVHRLASEARRRIDQLELDDLPEPCRRGMIVVSLTPRQRDPGPERGWRGADLLAPRSEQLDAARMWFRMSPWTRVLVRHRATRDGGLPFVATVSGVVVLGADVAGLDVDNRRGAALRLSEPGGWFECWRGGRFEAGKHGRWQWWDRTSQESERRHPPP